MRTRSRSLCFTAVLSLALTSLYVSAPSTAFADEEPSAADMASARALGQEGVKLADANNCQEAIDKLARAEKIFHAPTTLGRLGECQVQLGKIVEGTENLNKVVRESLAPGAPAAFLQAQERAKGILATARPKIAKLKIAVAAPPDAQMTVKVDGETIPLANLNTNRPIDPGEHNVEATAAGYKKAVAKVTLPEGGSDSVALTLEVDPNAPKVIDPVVPPPGTNPNPNNPNANNPAPPDKPTEPTSRVPAYVALGVGAIGVGLGTTFGLLALGKKGNLDDACGAAKQCGADQQDNIDTGKTFGTVSTVGFVIGAVGLVAGAYLFFTSGPSARAQTTGPSAKAKTVSPYISVDHVGLVF